MGLYANISVNPRNGISFRTYNVHRIRSEVEKFFRWLQSFKRKIMGYGKLVISYIAFIDIEYP